MITGRRWGGMLRRYKPQSGNSTELGGLDRRCSRAWVVLPGVRDCIVQLDHDHVVLRNVAPMVSPQ